MRSLKAALLCGLAALPIILTACEKADDPAAVHRSLGNEHARKGEWEAAAKEYGLAAQANPKDRKIWELKANAHMRLGQMNQAAESLLKPAEFMSDPVAKAECYRLVAAMYVEQKEFTEAEKAFGEALKFDPKDENSLSWLGEIASARGGARSMTDPADPVWLTKAISYYDKALALNPDNLFTYVHKRIALTKYLAFEEQERAQADRLVRVERKEESKAAAQARLTEATTRIADFQKQIEQLGTKIKQLQAAQKAKKATES